MTNAKKDKIVEKQMWCPDVCPISGREFFMWIEHFETGQLVPTYGGPYDSYTMPARREDGSFVCDRFDHDEGCWRTDLVICLGLKLVDDQALVVDIESEHFDKMYELHKKLIKENQESELT